LFFILFLISLTGYIDKAIIPASDINTRINLFRCKEKKLRAFFNVSTFAASQSIVWLTEEKYLFELRLSFVEFIKQKASPAEMAGEPIKASIKYARRTSFDHFPRIIL